MSEPAAAPPLPPVSCDVLVVGAGPAGSACAQQLARAGFKVVLCDQHEFPRDKVCGDGLIPDAHAAFGRLGVQGAVAKAAQRAEHVACIGPRGGRVDVPGRLSVLPRAVLDDILRRAAVDAGASWLGATRFEAPLLDGMQRVCGARLARGEARHELRANWVVLATGAVPQALIAAEVCERHTPSGVALRGYVRNPDMVGRITALEVVWHKALKRGYGWIFPCPGGVFNIGVGLSHSHAKSGDGHGSMADVNLREMFNRFCEVYAPAKELVTSGESLGPLKGAPLRCSLEGARFSRPGLLVTGEAAGSTYAFTGEGIGKAMETGILAAETIAEARDTYLTDAQARARYEAALLALKPRFDLYEKANNVNNHPWLADLVIARAQRSRRILNRMAAVLEEKGNPGNLVSLRGIVRLFVPIP
ncbi:MAG TPA: NAD(P)/FAD-dependent oxidoreductase [Burkholderiaceae bacterium]|nr:NAD(P)/FAD-dependent oxidoreductase [Burkholderiaceae bacterium]